MSLELQSLLPQSTIKLDVHESQDVQRVYVACREQGEREASPSADIVDSQSVKSAEAPGSHHRQRAFSRKGTSRKGSQEAGCRHRDLVIWIFTSLPDQRRRASLRTKVLSSFCQENAAH